MMFLVFHQSNTRVEVKISFDVLISLHISKM